MKSGPSTRRPVARSTRIGSASTPVSLSTSTMLRSLGSRRTLPQAASATMTGRRERPSSVSTYSWRRRENPDRTAAAIQRILCTQLGWAPDERTLQRNFHRLGLTTTITASASVFGRFEAEHPNDLWTGDALHGIRIQAHKTYLLAFLDDRSRLLPDTAGAMRKTPCYWRRRCARHWLPVAFPKPYTSTTDRPMWMRGFCGRARNLVCGWCIPRRAARRQRENRETVPHRAVPATPPPSRGFE